MRQRFAVVVALLFLLLVTSGSSVFATGPSGKPDKQRDSDAQFGGRQQSSQPDPDVLKKMEKARSKERYQDLKRDSEKLLELATELKQQVDKSGENVLSMDVVKKCDEIEKLAKSVRGKMKGD